MKAQTLNKLRNVYWYSYSDEPIATRGALKLCDPMILLPEESPDALWHMFAHTWIGIEHFISSSGLEWKRSHLLFKRAHSPYIYREGGTYYLLYEIHDKALFDKEKNEKIRSSRIMISSSTDLFLWSSPRMILNSEDIPLSIYKCGLRRISRPELIFWNGKYKLYFGAGETRTYDTGQKTTARLMSAESEYLDGKFRVNERPSLEVLPDSKYRNLAVGSVRVIACSDGVGALECAYSYDEKNNCSTTNVLLLTSVDGITFQEEKLIQQTAEEGWASRYITSVDLKYKEDENTWYCYYSANGKTIPRFGYTFIRESLGLLLGTD